MDNAIDKVLLDRQAIADRVAALAQQIAEDYRAIEIDEDGLSITLLAIPTGSLIFLADLIRDMPLKMQIRLMTVSSYPGKSTSSKGARIEGQIPDDLTGQHVLIIDDILDSGNTLKLVRETVMQRHPASVRACVLLRKPSRLEQAVEADYIGFDIDDEFVVGYGLDYDGFYRNHPEVVTLRKDVLTGEPT